MKWSALQASDTICVQEMLLLVNLRVGVCGIFWLSCLWSCMCAVPVHLLMVLHWGQ